MTALAAARLDADPDEDGAPGCRATPSVERSVCRRRWIDGARARVRNRLAAATAAGERGSAVIEFVFVALVVLLPLVYLIVAVAVVQHSQLVVTNAAREAGRAFATSPDTASAPERVAAAVRIALGDQDDDRDVTVRVVAAGDACTAGAVSPSLAPGSVFTVCVTRRVDVPAVPSVLAGRGITTVGRYTVHVDEFRDGGL
jgi:Flp pilus assembly protein TadG